MSQDFELFVSLAEIAGIFVAFGALITVTRRSEADPMQEFLLRFVVGIGLAVVVGSLVPIALGRYGFSGQTLWALSSGIFLAIIWSALVAGLLNRDTREAWLADARENRGFALFFFGVLETAIQVPLVLAILGVAPSLSPAFYTTALVINLCEAAALLARIVFTPSTKGAN